jgi:acyl-CoA thioesterase
MSERDQFARYLGIELIELRVGYCRVEMQLAPHMVNGLNMPHGGVIFSLADFAFAAACNSHGRAAVALSMDIHFIASPAPGSRLFAEAEEIHCGNRTGLYRMTVTDEQHKLIAELHGMAYRKDKNFLESHT